MRCLSPGRRAVSQTTPRPATAPKPWLRCRQQAWLAVAISSCSAPALAVAEFRGAASWFYNAPLVSPWQAGSPFSFGSSGDDAVWHDQTSASGDLHHMRASSRLWYGNDYQLGFLGSARQQYQDVARRGMVRIDGAQPGGPALLDVTLNFSVAGSLVQAGSDGSRGSSSFMAWLDFGYGQAASTSATLGNATAVPGFTTRATVSTGANQYAARLQVPVGQAFPLTLGLVVGSRAEPADGLPSWVDVTGSFSLGLVEQQPVFNLPAGYTAWSDDWTIRDNQFCPGICAAVPEPASWALMALGALLLAPVLRRRAR